MTRIEKIRQMLEDREQTHEEVTLIGKNFQLTGEVWYVFCVKEAVQLLVEGFQNPVLVPLDNITSVII